MSGILQEDVRWKYGVPPVGNANFAWLQHMIDRKIRELSEDDIKKIADTYQNWRKGKEYEDIQGFCKEASLEDIEQQDYILTPGRYVGIEEQEDDGESFDEKMKRFTTELSELFDKSLELQNEIRESLGAVGYEI